MQGGVWPAQQGLNCPPLCYSALPVSVLVGTPDTHLLTMLTY